MTDSAVTLENVSLEYDKKRILKSCSFSLKTAEICSLIGPSGSGKTSILRIIAGLLAPTKGIVRIREKVVSSAGKIQIPPNERALSVVFQDLALWPHLTIEQNLAFALKSKKNTFKKSEIKEKISHILEEVGLLKMAKRKTNALSGGEQQRVAIARAIVTEPTLIIMDEPLSNLDLALRQELIARFAVLFKKYNTAALYITHDPWEAQQLSKRVAIVDNGLLVFDDLFSALKNEHTNSFARKVWQYLAVKEAL